MKNEININDRKPIWIALSNFYLDTELDESDFRGIALKIFESPYTFEEVKNINKYEVFPVLNGNLLDVAGEWAGFDEESLMQKIVSLIEKDNKITKFSTGVLYFCFRSMIKDCWNKTEIEYKQLKGT